LRFVVATIHSIVNLIAITVERYLKVVHPYWSKKHLKRWMIHAAMIFAWIAGILSVAPIAFLRTMIKNGACVFHIMWENPMIKIILSIWYFFSFFFVPVLAFFFCYARIVVVMRKQAKVMAAHNVERLAQMSAAQIQNKRIKWNIIKTMIIVGACRLINFILRKLSEMDEHGLSLQFMAFLLQHGIRLTL